MRLPGWALSTVILLVSATAGAQEMSMPGPLGLPMERDSSGTAWQPDATPMHARHFMAGDWAWMLHGEAFFGYDRQWSRRGADALPSMNWVMAMVSRDLEGGARIKARVMLSAEPFTVPPRGYPLLLQSGETFGGEPLHDTQHPHDAFMETAVSIAGPISNAVALELYAAPAGEPALGPTAFPHRLSASSMPLAPIGHHWEDATHVSFGVVTAGVFTTVAKIEASWFNGREPDQNRLDFDVRALDSWSSRLSVNPTANLSLQTSWGFLASPEGHSPTTSAHLATTSAMWASPIGDRASLAATVVWGHKMLSGGIDATDSFLAEGTLELASRISFFSRAERVTKLGEDLSLSPPDLAHRYPLDALTVGSIVDGPAIGGLVPGIGAQFTADQIPASLEPYYGTRHPGGFMVFLRLHVAGGAHHHGM